MSLPKHSTALSPSIRSPRQSPRDSPASPVPPVTQPQQPQATTEEPTQEPATDRHNEDDPSHDTAQAPSEQQQHHPPFQPFFTLIEDAHSSEYFHPTVHYIFSDDDTDIVTEAALRSLETEQDGSNAGKGGPRREHQDQSQSEEVDRASDPPSPQKEALLPPSIPGVRDNYIILNVEPRPMDRHPDPSAPAPGPGTASLSTSPATQAPQPQADKPPPQQQFTVTSAQSLTPSWQVLDTNIVPAPTFENNTPGEQPVNDGLMLKVHGTAGVPLPGHTTREKEKGSQRLEEMMDQFAKRMSELRRVIETGEQEGPAEEPGDGDCDPAGKQERVDPGEGEVEDEREGKGDVVGEGRTGLGEDDAGDIGQNKGEHGDYS